MNPAPFLSRFSEACRVNWRILSTLIIKDFTLYFKNRFFALITVLGLVAYISIYFLMPNSVDETLKIGFYAPAVPSVFQELIEEDGLEIEQMQTEDLLKEAVLANDLPFGFALPDDFTAKIAAGEKAQIKVYFGPDMPEEFKAIYAVFLEELSFAMTGKALNIDAIEETLGPDMTGAQIAPRDRMIPLFAIIVLMMETMGLASLIVSEIEAGTLQALLVTPMRMDGLFVGKGIFGVGLAFIQTTIIVAVTGGLKHEPVLILLALLLGSMLATGIGFLIASVGKDMMSVMAWSMLAILVLTIPSFIVIFPGATTSWIKAMPSYYLIDTVHQVINFGAGWGDVGVNLLTLLVFSLAFMGLGVLVLRRRFR